jgi:hypothetical protein
MVRRNLLPLGVVGLGLFLLLGAILLLDENGSQGQDTGAVTEISAQNVPRVSLADAKAAYDSGEAVFIDVRTTGSYQEHHIPGALSIPLGELSGRLNDLDLETWYILYCT